LRNPPSSRKFFFPKTRNYAILCAIPTHLEGRFAIVTKR